MNGDDPVKGRDPTTGKEPEASPPQHAQGQSVGRPSSSLPMEDVPEEKFPTVRPASLPPLVPFSDAPSEVAIPPASDPAPVDDGSPAPGAEQTGGTGRSLRLFDTVGAGAARPQRVESLYESSPPPKLETGTTGATPIGGVAARRWANGGTPPGAAGVGSLSSSSAPTAPAISVPGGSGGGNSKLSGADGGRRSWSTAGGSTLSPDGGPKAPPLPWHRRLWRYVFRLDAFRLSMLISLAFIPLHLAKEFKDADLGFVDVLEAKVSDLNFRHRGVIPPSGKVTIVAIDEASLADHGRWPWPRDKVAELLRAIFDRGARVVAFDMVLADVVPDHARERLLEMKLAIQDQPEPKSAEARALRESTLERIDDVLSETDRDAILAEAIADFADRVVLGVFFEDRADEIEAAFSKDEQAQALDLVRVGTILRERHVNSVREGEKVPVQPWRVSPAFRPWLPMFCEATDQFAHFAIAPDSDGVVRATHLVHGLADPRYPTDPEKVVLFPSLALKSVALYLGGEAHAIGVDLYAAGIYGIHIMYDADGTTLRRDIPCDGEGRVFVKYHGPEKTIPHISARDVMRGAEGADLTDRIVFIGATATALYDLRVTPFDENFPGVEIHANVAENILSENFYARPWWAWMVEIGVTLSFGLIFGWFTLRLPGVPAAIAVVGGLVLFWVADRYVFFERGHQVRLVLILVQGMTIFLVTAVYRFVVEEAEKRFMRRAFSHYLNPAVVERIAANPDALKLGGEKREMTYLFSDLAGFTSIAEGMPPDKLTRLLNEYLTPMTDVVLKYDGLLDKYIGDAVMAVFGAPLDQKDHAERACRVALEMLRTVERMAPIWKEKYGVDQFHCRIGLNSGPAVVGNMGSERRFDYTVIGDAVNLAARMEPQNKEYDTLCLITENVAARVPGLFTLREIDQVRVKGKNRPIRIYELIDDGPLDVNRYPWIPVYERGLQAYKEQRWDDAEAAFMEADRLRHGGDPASKRFLDRVRSLRHSMPPPDWDGVWKMTTK